ncbi:MAG: DUF2171 domain-containing protein [Caulobacteraceae bacterium]
MDVVGSDGKHVGRVDHVNNDEIELAKLDLTTKGKHRMIPLSWIDFIDDKVHLSMDHEEAERRWIDKN